MTTLVLFTPETAQAVKEFVADPEKQALFRTPEAKRAYATGVEKVRRMAAQRRASLTVDPLLYLERINI